MLEIFFLMLMSSDLAAWNAVVIDGNKIPSNWTHVGWSLFKYEQQPSKLLTQCVSELLLRYFCYIYLFISYIQQIVMSKCILRNQKPENMGGRVMINQQKKTHEKKLHSIYSRPCKLQFTSGTTLRRSQYLSNSQVHQIMEHQRNIKHLFNFLSEPKKMRDRYKDPNDFYVYPALFFRETGKIKRNTKAKKTKKAKNKNVYSLTENSDEERKYGINPGLVSHHLPYITEFNQQEIEQYADAITRLIFNYNLNSPERLSYLKECVCKNIPQNYPEDFLQVVEQIFIQINESLNEARS